MKDEETLAFSITAPGGVVLYRVKVFVDEPSSWLKRLLWRYIFKGNISCKWGEIKEDV